MIYLVDAQYLVRRNFSAMTHNNQIITSDSLVRSVKSSFRKITSNINDTVWLLYDKQPYFKSESLPEYKGDREYVSEEGLQKLIDSGANECEIIKYRLDLHNNKEFINAKYKLIRDDNRSIIIRGYEADDLARMMSEYYNKNNEKCILYTIDSDWLYFCSDNTIMMTPKGIIKDKEYENILKNYSDYNVPISKIGVLYELFSTSHNNVPCYNATHNKDITFKSFCDSIYNNIDNIPDFDLYRKYYLSLSLHNHDLNIEEIVKDVHKRIIF